MGGQLIASKISLSELWSEVNFAIIYAGGLSSTLSSLPGP